MTKPSRPSKKNDYFMDGMQWTFGMVSLSKELEKLSREIKEDSVYIPAAIFNMTEEIKNTSHLVWDKFAMFFELAMPLMDWSKPIHIKPGVSHTFKDFDDFYARMCEPALGPYEHLKKTLEKFKSGEITQADGADQIAVARSNPTLTGDALRTAQAEGGKLGGRPRKGENLSSDPTKVSESQKRDKSYWLRRLATLDADTGSDWLDRIERGELTANGAAKAADTMKSATPGPEREIGKGKAGPGRGRKTGSDITRLSQGRGTDYLAARIKRDHPEIAARVEAGEFKSIRAAAIEAGIVKVATPMQQVRKLLPQIPRDQIVALVAEVFRHKLQLG